MQINELINEINCGICVGEDTRDTVKFGDENREFERVGVTMHATVEVLKAVKEKNIDFLIVHEPIFYSENENTPDLPVYREKKRLIDESGVTIYRFHDHPHNFYPDMITEGGLKALGITSTIEKTPYFASYTVELDKGVSAAQLVKQMQTELNLKNIRACGSIDKPCRKLAVCFGTPGGVFELLQREDIDMVLTGEICEWQLGEYARDANALGYTKSLVIMGHIGSEREGMKLLAERLKNDTRFVTEYIECGEVFNTII